MKLIAEHSMASPSDKVFPTHVVFGMDHGRVVAMLREVAEKASRGEIFFQEGSLAQETKVDAFAYITLTLKFAEAAGKIDGGH